MKYSFTVYIHEDVDILHDCLIPEMSERDRSKVTIAKEGKATKITMEAQDAVALRAAVNSIIKLLITHEKIKQVHHDEERH